MINPNQTIFTAAEAAEYLRMSVKAIYAKNSTAEIEHIKLGRSVRYEKAALDAYLNKHRVKARGD